MSLAIIFVCGGVSAFVIALTTLQNKVLPIFLFLIEAFDIVCLLVWGWTLKKLFSDVQKAKDVLPSKTVFQLHAALLILYLVFSILANVANYVAGN